MPLDWPIRSVISNAAFWRDYFWQSESSPAGDGYLAIVNHEEPVSAEKAAELRRYNVVRTKWQYCRLDIPLGKQRLRLKFDPQLSSVNLNLCDQSGKEFELGWDDQAHWHPHVLRCEELDKICRSVARQDASLPHPGVPLLLFCRFAPVTDSGDSEHAISLLREAWRSLDLFDDPQICEFLKMVDYRATGVEWRQDAQLDWALHLDRDLHSKVGLYTLRCKDNPDFPFKALVTALDEAALT